MYHSHIGSAIHFYNLIVIRVIRVRCGSDSSKLKPKTIDFDKVDIMFDDNEKLLSSISCQ